MRKVLAISYEVNTRQLNYRERAKYLLPVNSLPYLKLIIENWWINCEYKKNKFQLFIMSFFIYLAKEIKCYFFVKEYNIKNNTKIRPRLYFIQPIRWLIRLITRWKMSCYRKKNLSLKKNTKNYSWMYCGKSLLGRKSNIVFRFLLYFPQPSFFSSHFILSFFQLFFV